MNSRCRSLSAADPLNDPGEQGGAVQIGPDDGVGLRRGGCEPAYRPVGRLLLCGEGEGLGVLVPRLDLQLGEIHAAGVHPWGRPRLETADGQPQIYQAPGQGQSGGQAVRPGVPDHLAHDGPPPQVSAGGHNGRLHPVDGSGVGDHPGHRAALREDLHHLGLLHPQVLLKLQGVLHHLLVLPPVRLGPQGPDRGALPPVQDAVLDTGPVGSPAHLAPQGVQFPDQVALSGTADGRVAGHIAHRIQVNGEAQGAQPHPGGGQGSLNARVARADDRDVKFSRVVVNHSKFLFGSDLAPGVRRLGTGILYHSLTIGTRGVQAAPASFPPPARHRGKAGISRGQAGQNNSRSWEQGAPQLLERT